MTLDEARKRIGGAVAYRHGLPGAEEGEIIRVSGGLVMVLYKGDRTAKATYPADLTLLAGEAPRGQ